MREIIFDTETTGLDNKSDRVIEFGGVELDNKFPTGNSFHVYINADGKKVHPEALEVHGITDEFLEDKPLFKDISADLQEFLKGAKLVAHNANFDIMNTILVGYAEGATMERDRMFDAITNAYNTKIYSIIGNEKFVIQGRAMPFIEEDVIPLGVNITSPGNYYIAITDVEGLFDTGNQTVYLKDNLLNYTHNLSSNPYMFTIESGEFNNRFELVFVNQSLSTEDNILTSNDLSIIQLEDDNVKFSVSKSHYITKIEILDLQGRTLYNIDGTSYEEIIAMPNLSNTAYLAKVTLASGQTLVKKAVKY